MAGAHDRRSFFKELLRTVAQSAEESGTGLRSGAEVLAAAAPRHAPRLLRARVGAERCAALRRSCLPCAACRRRWPSERSCTRTAGDARDAVRRVDAPPRRRAERPRLGGSGRLATPTRA